MSKTNKTNKLMQNIKTEKNLIARLKAITNLLEDHVINSEILIQELTE